MRQLADHYRAVRETYPNDRLLLLFDIDGTILDLRYAVLHVLSWYDFVHGTGYFSDLSLEDVDVHEDDVDYLLERRDIAAFERERIRSWYRRYLWSPEAFRVSHVPYRGVLEIIRWFQLQPNTFVGLNTGRPESMRTITLESLNRLGAEFKVSFSSELLHMSQGTAVADVLAAKVTAIEYFRSAGYRIVAVVDNEPAVLRAIREALSRSVVHEEWGADVLLLHADTLFRSRRDLLPAGAACGSHYDIVQVVAASSLPRHIEFVWHRANSRENLELFLASSVRWVELDVRLHPLTGEPVLRHDSFVARPPTAHEPLMRLDEALGQIREAGRAAKVDLKENGLLLELVLDVVKARGFPEEDLWFNGDLDCLRKEGIRSIAQAMPGAVVQVPVQFLSPLVLGAPDQAAAILKMLKNWGVNRVSVNWKTENKRELLDLCDKLGLPVNIYNVPDLEAFLQAVLLSPRSITADFNFPQWGYFGQGLGAQIS